jgi:hypothetical protein
MSETDGRPRGRPTHKITSKAKATPFEPGDEQPAYTHAQLIHFDNRFRARLLWAFQEGLESRESAAAAWVEPVSGNEPFRILTAHRRASQYRNLADVTPSVP